MGETSGERFIRGSKREGVCSVFRGLGVLKLGDNGARGKSRGRKNLLCVILFALGGGLGGGGWSSLFQGEGKKRRWFVGSALWNGKAGGRSVGEGGRKGT